MGVLAIIGRPNVGKSTLFNKLAGRRVSIVDDTPGVTRDRITADCEWNGARFTLIDTGGIEPERGDGILLHMKKQAELAIETADAVLFLTDLRDGVTASDMDVAALLQKSGKPVLLAVNKADSVGGLPMGFYEFYNLGIGEPFAISALHGLGVGDLLDEAVKLLPQNVDESENDVLRVAVVGKPNAGKSSLINRILGEERVIVSPVAGTTRDAVDTFFEKDGARYGFIDTAGMRKRGRIDENIERYSVLRALGAVDRANVCVVLIDANEGVTEQDTKIAGYAHEQGKACVVAVNKWDLVEKDDKTMAAFRKKVEDGLAFMPYAPVAFISALTGQRVNRLFELIAYVDSQNATRISTGLLNDCLGEATAKAQPPSDKGKRLKIYYMTQAVSRPPTFVVFVNDKELAHFSYMRYLENQIRATFGLEGTPVRFIVRERKNSDKSE
jgi:GTP-binding protein